MVYLTKYLFIHEYKIRHHNTLELKQNVLGTELDTFRNYKMIISYDGKNPIKITFYDITRMLTRKNIMHSIWNLRRKRV